MQKTFELKNFRFDPMYDEKKLPLFLIDITKSYKNAWKEIDQFLSEFSLTYGHFKINWNRSISNETESSTQIIISTNKEHVDHYFELVLCDIFLITNLASPGCFDLYGSCFDSKILDLDGSRFESSWVYAKTSNVINIVSIPINKVLNWYKYLNIGTRQTANTKIEKALFAVLHYCDNSQYCPSKMMWLRFALDALYDNLFSYEITKQLIKTGITPIEGFYSVQTQLCRFYNVTDQFTTGKYNILHPLENDIIDRELDDKWELMDLCRFALAIIIAKLQKEVIEFN